MCAPPVEGSDDDANSAPEESNVSPASPPTANLKTKAVPDALKGLVSEDLGDDVFTALGTSAGRLDTGEEESSHSNLAPYPRALVAGRSPAPPRELMPPPHTWEVTGRSLKTSLAVLQGELPHVLLQAEKAGRDAWPERASRL